MPSVNDFAESGCTVCSKFLEDMKKPVNGDELTYSGYMTKLVEDNMKHVRQTHKEVARKQYAFTFTTNSDDRLKSQRELCYATQKLFTQKTNPIAQGGAWLEYTEAGRPHIHGWYETEDGGRVFAKTFARCWYLWKEKRGMTRFPGGYHEQMKTNRYINYASVEGREVIRKKVNEPSVYNFDAEKMELNTSNMLIYTNVIDEEIEQACSEEAYPP